MDVNPKYENRENVCKNVSVALKQVINTENTRYTHLGIGAIPANTVTGFEMKRLLQPNDENVSIQMKLQPKPGF